LEIVFSNSETCCSEHQLFSALAEQLKNLQSQDQPDPEHASFLKDMLAFVRLPLMNMKQLVTDIKFSGYFEDKAIFEALQFQVAREVLERTNDLKFVHRGIRTQFDHKHFDLSIKEDLAENMNIFTTAQSTQPVQKSLQIVRDKFCQSTDDSTIAAIMGEPLPMHGIHYWEVKLKTENPSFLKKVYLGLCNKSDNLSLENTYRSKSAILLNCFDSTFWNNG
jgi:hypothetical protein